MEEEGKELINYRMVDHFKCDLSYFSLKLNKLSNLELQTLALMPNKLTIWGFLFVQNNFRRLNYA